MMTGDDRIRAARDALIETVHNVVGHNAVSDEHPNDSLGQLKANALFYAHSVDLARKVCSFAQLLDDLPALGDVGKAYRALRPLCCDIVGAHTWSESEAAPRVEKIMCQAHVCGTGYELARKIIDIERFIAGGL